MTLSWLWLACAKDGAPVDNGGTAECSLSTDNVLRGLCSVSLPEPGPVEIVLTDGVETLRFTDDAALADHVIPLWGLRPESTWTWSVTEVDASGTLEAGSLPPEVQISFTISNPEAPSEIEVVLAPLACGAEAWAVMYDRDGVIRWYQDLQRTADQDLLLQAINFSEDGQVLATIGASQVVAFDLTGVNTSRFTAPHVVHHDVTRKDGVTYALMADEYVEDDGNRYVEDIVGGFDAEGNQVYEFETHDNFPADPPDGPPSTFWAAEFPGATDGWHTNGMYWNDAGELYLSTKRVDTVVKVVDRAVVWTMEGDGLGDFLPADFEIVSTPDGSAVFAEQHHPGFMPNGHFTLFDNSNARGLELALDEAARTVTFVAEYPVEGPCPFQGSVYALDGGHVLVNCSTTANAFEFDAAGTLLRRFAPRCPAGPLPFQAPRAVPVDLFDAQVGTVRASRDAR